jgi:hypothetical protein
MGIKNLNRYMMTRCGASAISNIHLSTLRGKKIVIDTSIYLYKYIGENSLLENFFSMISIFRYYQITPLFIFDGRAPVEKKELVNERKTKKEIAENQYKHLAAELETVDPTAKQEIIDEMTQLKKQFIRIKDADIRKTKEFMTAMGVSYIDASGEADELCAYLVIQRHAYACMSEDMDLFLYGCPRVLRYMSLLKHHVMFYDLSHILGELGNIHINDFKQILVISGTDYNIHDETNLYETMRWYEKYKKTTIMDENRPSFLAWLSKNTKYIKDKEHLEHILEMFQIVGKSSLKEYDTMKIEIAVENREQIIEMLKEENFIMM